MIDTLFNNPHIGSDAIYRVGGAGGGTPVRVVRRAPDDTVALASLGAVAPVLSADVRVSEVAAPAEGDTVEIDAVAYVVTRAVRDAHNLVHTLALDYP